MHHGKTQVWNRGGVEPQDIDIITAEARIRVPGAVVWRGAQELPATRQGLKVLGAPIGHPQYVQEFLRRKSEEQQVLFQRIPLVNDPQASWLLLWMCASTRANFWLRMVSPALQGSVSRSQFPPSWLEGLGSGGSRPCGRSGAKPAQVRLATVRVTEFGDQALERARMAWDDGRRESSPKVSTRSACFRSSDRSPNLPGHKDGRSTLPHSVAPTSQAPFASVLPHLPMWPPT